MKEIALAVLTGAASAWKSAAYDAYREIPKVQLEEQELDHSYQPAIVSTTEVETVTDQTLWNKLNNFEALSATLMLTTEMTRVIKTRLIITSTLMSTATTAMKTTTTDDQSYSPRKERSTMLAMNASIVVQPPKSSVLSPRKSTVLFSLPR